MKKRCQINSAPVQRHVLKKESNTFENFTRAVKCVVGVDIDGPSVHMQQQQESSVLPSSQQRTTTTEWQANAASGWPDFFRLFLGDTIPYMV